MTVRLPVVDERGQGSLRRDGTRIAMVPADVKGRFQTLRRVTFALLGAVYVLLPWIQIGGHPAVLLDIEHRRFHLFGHVYNAQDIWLVFFLMSGTAFSLVVVAALFGRVWCGYACPQTVFLEGLFRPIERWLEGSRAEHLRRDQSGWSWGRALRKGAKHTIYVVAALVLSHIFLSYFVSTPIVFLMMKSSPTEHLEAFLWTFAFAGLFYFNFGWFREQFCVVMCPYGRLQSALGDADTIVVGYDKKRGEPRGKATDPNAGACVDCMRCVVVCPTGIDIRNGQQLDCVGCAACVDACDDVMHSLGRTPGLVRYDSLNGLAQNAKRFWRPRVALYSVLLVAGLVALTLATRHHQLVEANFIRLSGAPYVIENGVVRNSYELHLINKLAVTANFEIEPAGPLTYTIARRHVSLAPLQDVHIPVFVTQSEAAGAAHSMAILTVRVANHPEATRTVQSPFLTPADP